MNIDEHTQALYDILNQHDPKDCTNPCWAVINLKSIMAENYQKAFTLGGIEVINNTCEICHAYPMTVDCNNAGCDK